MDGAGNYAWRSLLDGANLDLRRRDRQCHGLIGLALSLAAITAASIIVDFSKEARRASLA